MWGEGEGEEGRYILMADDIHEYPEGKQLHLCFSELLPFLPCFDSKWDVNWGRPGFDPEVGKIPCRRERLPTPIFWPREFHKLKLRGRDYYALWESKALYKCLIDTLVTSSSPSSFFLPVRFLLPVVQNVTKLITERTTLGFPIFYLIWTLLITTEWATLLY